MKKILNDRALFDKENEKWGLPVSDDVSVIAEPVKIKNKTIHNRLVCQAMEGCDGEASGAPAELTKRRYKRLAEGGAGLIWFEATAVLPEARANTRQLYINEENLDAFKRLAYDIKEWGFKANGYAPVVVMQATHSGRYSKPSGSPAPLVAYSNPYFEKDKPLDKSRIMSDGELERACEALINAAGLAEKAGFDGVDIKSCHGYLLCELLSAFTREGKYGGSYENRTRLYKNAVKGAIENTAADFIVSSRLNIYDGFPYPYGFGTDKEDFTKYDLTEPKMLAWELADMGVELLNITMGNPYQNPHINRPYAKGGYEAPEDPMQGVKRMLSGISELQKAVPNVKLIASAMSFLGKQAPNVAAAYIRNGGFAFAGFGRQIFAYPDFAKDILAGGLDEKKCCLACSKCTEIMRAGGRTGCVIRDKEVYLPIYDEYCKK